MIVIPMAGMSSRFFKAGYEQPKYMLPAHGKSLFAHCVESFKEYFSSEKFLFIIRDVYDTEDFVNSECKQLNILDYQVISLHKPTRGQAETVFLGLEACTAHADESITIFNIDTMRPGFRHPVLNNDVDGYLEVFKGSGDNWSFAREDTENPGYVAETAEKNPISDLCSDGLYYFRNISLFRLAYEKMEAAGEAGLAKGEQYIAPMYNYLIQAGYKVSYVKIASKTVIFSGTPDEYTAFLETTQ